MAKSNAGGTRASSSSAPTGLGAVSASPVRYSSIRDEVNRRVSEAYNNPDNSIDVVIRPASQPIIVRYSMDYDRFTQEYRETLRVESKEDSRDTFVKTNDRATRPNRYENIVVTDLEDLVEAYNNRKRR